jgi:alpha-L-fucosidase 2
MQNFVNRSPLILLLILIITGCEKEGTRPQNYRIWFTEPAAIWEATLPLGNGHIGMMPDSKINDETIVLNDITLWSGGVQDPDNPDAAGYLPEIQKLLFEGKNDKAQELVYKTFVCRGKGSGQGNGANVPYGSFEVLGNLHLQYDYDAVADTVGYQRQLSLNDAIADCRFTLNGTTYSREYFVSFTNDVGVIRVKADRKGKINLKIGMDRPEKFVTLASGNLLKMSGQLNNGTDGKGMRYLAILKAVNTGGNLSTENNHLTVKDADEVTLYISIRTDFKNPAYETDCLLTLQTASAKKFDELRKSHIAGYQKYFDRVSIQLNKNTERESWPTPERLLAFDKDPDDNGLVNLYFQFGRYLLISSTYKRILPPNLQGLWANTIQTPWNGDYHLNINVQMNHWPAEITNLSELQLPLVELIKSLVEPGTRTAGVFYKANGWVAHVITNVWGYSAPGEHPSWGATNTGGAWLCAHLWEHYDYNRDTAFLKEIYPVLKGAAEFFLDMLVTEPEKGWLVTAPTTSPENAYLMPGSKYPVNVCMGSTMDNQIIRELFGNVITAANLLGTDQELAEKLAKVSAKLPPSQIGKDGRLMEWLKEYEEVEPQHRHVSHLYGLHPGNQITPDFTPELAEAARKSLEKRGDGGTGWSRAWKINFWARLYDGNHAFIMLKKLLEPVYDTGFNYTNKGGTYPNLFCGHPPFQIDGNFGGTAGIAEMFVQSHAGFINLIPALPDQFSEGSFTGLRVRGGGIVSARWKDKKLTEATLQTSSGGKYRIKIPSYSKSFLASVKGKPVKPEMAKNIAEIDLKKGEILRMKFQVFDK